MFRAIFAHLQKHKTVVYSNVVYCPNVVVGWRSGVRRRRLCVRCEGCCSVCGLLQQPANRTHNPQLHTIQTTWKPNTTGSNRLYNTLELPMMGIVVPETCWASNKICNKNHLLHLVGILFPHIDDAQSKSHQRYNRVKNNCCERVDMMIPVASTLLHACRKTRKPTCKDTIHLASNADLIAQFFFTKDIL